MVQNQAATGFQRHILRLLQALFFGFIIAENFEKGKRMFAYRGSFPFWRKAKAVLLSPVVDGTSLSTYTAYWRYDMDSELLTAYSVEAGAS